MPDQKLTIVPVTLDVENKVSYSLLHQRYNVR
ncbi:hypothetical protein SAMN05192533_1346 [Mesobacillus persicus]|uniref:Uncharacterized protein n=1 Tax=Mesobacillus persicus TaxID=930146 RepID=A0A1H8KWT2_9BACI|nr:hypothetical protein SAMN05192533_1346 [Mesobacillus persicus]